MTQKRDATTNQRLPAEPASRTMLWLLNCYDLWSATPRTAEDCDCLAPALRDSDGEAARPTAR